MTRTEARQALDELGIDYPKSGKGSGLSSLVELLDAAKPAPRTKEEVLRQDHGFDFYKTINGYGWRVLVGGEVYEERWRARHSGQQQRIQTEAALRKAQQMINRG